jgi:O-antigen/teichoic acid export membrane protein
LPLFCVALTSTVVARNLTLADLGVFGLAGIIIGFLSRFSDMGVGNAVIRRPELHQHNLETTLSNIIELG